jgi:hypothetical protein
LRLKRGAPGSQKVWGRSWTGKTWDGTPESCLQPPWLILSSTCLALAGINHQPKHSENQTWLATGWHTWAPGEHSKGNLNC